MSTKPFTCSIGQDSALKLYPPFRTQERRTFKTFIQNFITLPNKIKAMSDYKLFCSKEKDLLKEAFFFFPYKFVADYAI